jgi:hypothetical protein
VIRQIKPVLKSIGLIDTFFIKVKIGKAEFLQILRENIDEPKYPFIYNLSASKNLYHGTVGDGKFQLRRKRGLLSVEVQPLGVKGRFIEDKGVMVIIVEMNGFYYGVFPLWLFVVFILLVSTGSVMTGNIDATTWPAFVLLPLVMLIMPYMFVRRAVKKTSLQLERDILTWFGMKGGRIAVNSLSK